MNLITLHPLSFNATSRLAVLSFSFSQYLSQRPQSNDYDSLNQSSHWKPYFVHVAFYVQKVKLVFIFSVILTINRNYFTVHILVKVFV